MARTEIVDCCRVEILIDHRRADVRVARSGWSVSKLLSDRAHDRRNCALGVGFRLGRSAFGQCDGSDQRAAPRPKVLRRELFAEVSPYVVVQLRAGERTQTSVPLVAKETSAPGQSEQLLDRIRQFWVHERRANSRAVLASEVECNAVTTHTHVVLAERRD